MERSGHFPRPPPARTHRICRPPRARSPHVGRRVGRSVCVGGGGGEEGSRPSVAVQVTSLLTLQTLPLPKAEEKGGATVVTGNAISDRHREARPGMQISSGVSGIEVIGKGAVVFDFVSCHKETGQ